MYASKGVAPGTLEAHLNEFYDANPAVPLNRRPNLIHVAGSCLLFRGKEGMGLTDLASGTRKPIAIGTYYLQTENPDLSAIVWTLNELQKNATVSTQIVFSYDSLIDKVSRLR